jgi:hypothetical protein
MARGGILRSDLIGHGDIPVIMEGIVAADTATAAAGIRVEEEE